jgi:hypothetical protein
VLLIVEFGVVCVGLFLCGFICVCGGRDDNVQSSTASMGSSDFDATRALIPAFYVDPDRDVTPACSTITYLGNATISAELERTNEQLIVAESA